MSWFKKSGGGKPILVPVAPQTPQTPYEPPESESPISLPPDYELTIEPREEMGHWPYRWNLHWKHNYIEGSITESEQMGIREAEKAIKAHEKKVAHLAAGKKRFVGDKVIED